MKAPKAPARTKRAAPKPKPKPAPAKRNARESASYLDLASRLLLPARASLPQAHQLVARLTKADQAWEALVAGALVPEAWLDDKERRFSPPSRCGTCDHGRTKDRPGLNPFTNKRMIVKGGLCPACFTKLKTLGARPASVADAELFASDAAALARVEALATETLVRVEGAAHQRRRLWRVLDPALMGLEFSLADDLLALFGGFARYPEDRGESIDREAWYESGVDFNVYFDVLEYFVARGHGTGHKHDWVDGDLYEGLARYAQAHAWWEAAAAQGRWRFPRLRRATATEGGTRFEALRDKPIGDRPNPITPLLELFSLGYVLEHTTDKALFFAAPAVAKKKAESRLKA